MTKDLTAEARETVARVIDIFVDEKMKAAGQPEKFWGDDYVLGFLMCAAVQLTQARLGEDFDPTIAADVAFDIIGDESGQGVQAVKDRVGALQNSGSLDYLQAMKLADKMVRFIGGSATAALDPVVLQARTQVQQMYEGGSLDPENVPEDVAVRGMLVRNLFTDPVAERLGLNLSD